MGLGGLTRDSIIGLNNLVHDDEEDKPCHSRRHSGSGNLSNSWNNGPDKDTGDFLFLEEDDAALPPSESQASFETSLNDGLTSRTFSPATATSSKSPRTLGYSNVSATNSRSLDSYRRKEPVDPSSYSSQVAHYQGFQYDAYADYYSDEYNDDFSYSIGSKGENKNAFCCFFPPWAQPKLVEAEDQSVVSGLGEELDSAEHVNESGNSPSAKNAIPTSSPSPFSEANSACHSTEAKSTPTSCFHSVDATAAHPPKEQDNRHVGVAAPSEEAEKSTLHILSDGLSDLESIDSLTSAFDEKKQDEGDIVGRDVNKEAVDEGLDGDAPLTAKGILKVKRCSLSLGSLPHCNISRGGANETASSSSPHKRHLFPSYEPKKVHTGSNVRNEKSIQFNPMARVLTIPSRKDIPFHQKAQVWWQKCDYDEFKKTGRIISKAMECGGSEIWLASSNAWGKRAAESQKQKTRKENLGATVGDSDEYNKALSKYINDEEKKDDEHSSNDAAGDKWWCKFGHSRRGLEHIASSSEGKARQQSVLLAIRMVLEEQKRQRITRTKDPNKLRNVAMQYTSWARDLSLAAGSADAEAVSSNFNPSATCRARHFAKRFGSIKQTNLAGGGVALAVTSQILDANTHLIADGGSIRSNSRHDVNNGLSHVDVSLSRRAKGYIPGG